MEEAAMEEDGGLTHHVRARHIRKRALKNKALSVSFNEKDLKDFVTGFHKRKKKRRKEAQHQQQEADRRKCIELRKKRKLEREYAIYGDGGAPLDEDAEPNELGEDDEQEEENDPLASVSGTTMYDHGDVKVIVTTSEISREEEELNGKVQAAIPRLTTGFGKKHNLPVTKKKQLKKVAKRRSRPKPQSKRDRKKGKKRNNKQ